MNNIVEDDEVIESDTSLKILKHRFSGMGSPCCIYLIHNNADKLHSIARAAQREVERLEKKYSRYRDDSVVTAINRSAGSGCFISIDVETAGLLAYAEQLYHNTLGIFDVTSGVLRHAWNFTLGQIPEEKVIQEGLEKVGWHNVDWTETNVRLLKPGMEIDFGGCVKEYAADSVAGLCRRGEVVSGYVDLGGDIAVIGPPPDAEYWQFSVRHPQMHDQPIASIPLSEGGLTTSGTYERYMIIDGIRYSHLLNAKTGWPLKPENHFCSVSVVAQHAMVAGSASTIAMLLGEKEGEAWLKQSGLVYLAIDQELQLSSNAHC